MSGNGNQVPLAPNQRGPGPYPRASTPHRGDCYIQGPAYMAGTGGAPPTGPSSMRTQNAPQSAPQPPQDMQNSTLAGHNFVTQSGQVRSQFNNFSYGVRPTQHAARPSNHPRQQNYMAGGGAANAPVLYSQSMMFSAAHMSMPPSYQQPRQPYTYNLYTPYMNYNNTPNHTPSYTYYTPGSRQMPAQTLAPNNGANRSNISPHVVPQGATAAQTVPPNSMHLTQTQLPFKPIPGLNTAKRSFRIPIIDPDTNKDIFSDMENETQQVSGENNDTHNDLLGIREDFARRVSQAASEPSINDTNLNTIVAKNINTPINITMSPPTSTFQAQQNAVSTVDIVKSDVINVNDNLSVVSDVNVNDTPVVSAISDSPVIVPKVPVNKKQVKNNDLPLAVDNVKQLPPNKPIVPQTSADEILEVDEVLTISIDTLPPQPQRVKDVKEIRKFQDVSEMDSPLAGDNINADSNGPVIQIPDPKAANGTANTSNVSVEQLSKDVKKIEIVEKPEVTAEKPSSTSEVPQKESIHENTTITVTSEKEPEIKIESEKKVEEVAPKPRLPPPPKYHYAEGDWSPLNPTGRKHYDIGLLLKIKDDPLTKQKPENSHKLEQCKVLKSMTIQEPLSLAHFVAPRPTSDALFPNFLKVSDGIPKRDIKNSSRSSLSGKNLKPSSSSSSFKSNVTHISLSLTDDVKLNETENAWKPTRLKKTALSPEEQKTQEVYKQFRGILNKLTPQKFDSLMEKVKALEIDNQKRLEGVIDLVFDKAIDEPNFSEAYASMCNKLSKLMVPSDNNPDQCVNFRALIISKCQTLFMTKKVDDQVKKLEQEISECTDPVKKKELSLLLEEENRKVRMRSVGNVRFIGELYKLKMLTYKIMVFCMTTLTENCEPEKLECLCKLLTTIGEQIEMEKKDKLDEVFKTMQQIVNQKGNKISSRVRFMLQDVIELRKRRWVTKTVVDLQPKMMDQIQKEAEQQHRQTELLNSMPFRRDDGGRGKRDGRRGNQNSFLDNNSNWKPTTNTYSVDTSKFKVVRNSKIQENIKLAPSNIKWDMGSSTKAPPTNAFLSLPTSTNNKFSVLETTIPEPIPKSEPETPSYLKCASIERSTFNTREDHIPSGPSRSLGIPHPIETAQLAPPPEPAAPILVEQTVPQEVLTEQQVKQLKTIIDQSLLTPDDNEVLEEIKLRFKPEHHSSIVTGAFNIAIEKSPKDINVIAKSLLYLVTSNGIKSKHFLSGLKDFLEAATDLYIDIPMLYTYLSYFIVPQIEKKHITLLEVHKVCDTVITAKHGHLLLRELLKELKESMGPSFVKSKWQDSTLTLNQWMSDDMVQPFSEEFDFLTGGVKASEEVKKTPSPSEAQSKLLQLMIADESCECIRGWVEDNIGKASNEDWFMRTLIQALCEYALYGAEPQSIPHFNQDRMTKYSELIHEFGPSKDAREANCLFGIQQLVHRLEHPQGLTLDIFQYLHEQYLISVEGFISWEESDKEPEGKGVMMKALTSFFTNIKEVDNEDSFSED